MVFCPFLRKKGFCLKGSNCDFSHSDLNQNTATNQPLSNENQLGNDQLPFLEKIQKNMLLTLNHIERTLQRMEVYQTIPPRYPTPFCPLPPPLAVRQPPYQRPPIFQPRRTVNGDPLPSPTKAINDGHVYLPNVLIANVRSLSGKVDELSVIAKVNDVDIICITESWLMDLILDCTCSLTNFNLFRNDRKSTVGGGICVYINSRMRAIESLWISVRPDWLPRSISVILIANVYHSTSRNAEDNLELYNHIQSNVDLFLLDHPDALVMICGDFNPATTGFNANRVKQTSGLRQIIKVPTRGEAILDWCLINMKHLNFEIIQLPAVGSSDHNSILKCRKMQKIINS